MADGDGSSSVAIVAIVLILVLAVGGWYFFMNKGGSSTVNVEAPKIEAPSSR